jgi:laccase
MISPGQTMNALLVADRATDGSCNSRYYMAARTFSTNTNMKFNNSTATAIIEYNDTRRRPRGRRTSLASRPSTTSAR